MKRIIEVGFALALAGCTSPAPAAVPQVAPVSASFGRTWAATVEVLAERAINIKTIDRSSGYVAAEATQVPTDTLKRYTTNYGGFMASLITLDDPATTRYNILVKGDSSGSTVRVTMLTSIDVGSGETAKCSSNGTFEQALQRDIKARAEAR